MQNIKEIAVKDIQISKLNPRRSFNPQKMQELQNSIKEKGVIVPITVRPLNGKYEVVYGERRLKALQKVGEKTIPSIISELTDTEVLEFQVIENLQREDLHPLEEAEGYEALLKKHGYKSADDIAAKVGKSKAYVYGRMKLCDLIPANRSLFYAEKFSPSVALLVARIPADLQKEAGKNVAEGEEYGDGDPMSYREAKEYIHDNFMLQLKNAPFNPKDKDLAGKKPCAECSKRTGNQKELFPDISSADVCTDPACFELKKKAFGQLTIARAKNAGKKVLSLDENKKVFPYSSSSPEKGFIRLDATCYDDDKRRSYKQLSTAHHKDAEIVYAVHPEKNEVVALITQATAAQIIKKAGVKIKSGSPTGSSHVYDLAKAKTANRIREAKRGFWIDKVSAARDRRCMNVVVLNILLEDMGWSEAQDLLKGKVKGKGYGRCWTIPKLYELGDAEVQKLIVKVISKKSGVLDSTDLEFLSTKLGFNIAKEYVITETYLQAMTKDQLVTLSGTIGLTKYLRAKVICESIEGAKKTELIEFFLKKGFKLDGKVPKEIAK